MIEPTEKQICAALVEWAQHKGIFLVHIPNEGARGKWGNAEQKRLGLIKGFPDYFIPIPNGLYHGMFLEIKKKGKNPTKEQEEVMLKLRIKGYYSEWTDNFDEAIIMISSYLS